MINKSLPEESWSEEDGYRATRYAWKLSNQVPEKAEYALGVSN